MAANVMVLLEHSDGVASDGAEDLIAKGRELAGALGCRCEVLVLGAPELARRLRGADVVVSVAHPSLERYVPEAYEAAVAHVLTHRRPRLLLLSHGTVGLDLAPALALGWDAPLVAYASALGVEDGAVVVTSQILGGKVLADFVLTGEHGVVTVLAAALHSASGTSDMEPEVVDLGPPAALGTQVTALARVVSADDGDVDISAAEMLVSVGRGIGSEDNLEVISELAEALGVPLSASRPVIDAGWLPKSRQVGQSGTKVKPRAYLAFGISGAPEHLEGMRDAELIVACNTDPRAPIFAAAHYGTTVDLFDLVPEIVERIRTS